MRIWILNWKNFSESFKNASSVGWSHRLDSGLRCLALVGVQFYRVHLKWFVVGDCRYYPSCSQYAVDVLNNRQFFKAVLAIFGRLLRCHPWSQGGYDPGANCPSQSDLISTETSRVN